MWIVYINCPLAASGWLAWRTLRDKHSISDSQSIPVECDIVDAENVGSGHAQERRGRSSGDVTVGRFPPGDRATDGSPLSATATHPIQTPVPGPVWFPPLPLYCAKGAKGISAA